MNIRSWITAFHAANEHDPKRARRRAVALSALVFATLITHGHFAGSGDPIHYLVIAHSVAFDRDLDVANNYREMEDLLHVGPGQHAQPGRGGVLRPVHDVGMPVLASPVFWGAYHVSQWSGYLRDHQIRIGSIDPWITLRQLISLSMIGVTCCLVILFARTLTELPTSGGGVLLGTLAWTLAPPVLSHGYVFFTEIPSALVALASYRSLANLRQWSIARAVWSGCLAGLLVLLHTRNVGLLVGLVVVAALRRGWSARTAVSFTLGILAILSGKIAVNYEFWGTFLVTPLARTGSWDGFVAVGSEVALRAAGLLFDPNHGLLPVAPLYLLAPLGWLLLRRRNAAVAYDIAIVVACYLVPVLLPMVNVQGWRGGWSPAARFLTPVAPFLGLGLAHVLATGWRNSWVVRGICLLQFALSAFFWAFPLVMWTDASAGPPFVEFALGQRAADMLPRWDSWGIRVGLESAAMLGGWLLATAVVARAGWWSANNGGTRRG